jgi:hypothetical protein
VWIVTAPRSELLSAELLWAELLWAELLWAEPLWAEPLLEHAPANPATRINPAAQMLRGRQIVGRVTRMPSLPRRCLIYGGAFDRGCRKTFFLVRHPTRGPAP